MESVLDKIKTLSDVKTLSFEESTLLASELRDFILSSVAKTGGHLSSNLGVIELSIALAQAFDFDKDRVVWDVGHQSYAWKILTGRREAFSTLRQKDGLSGFPKREESIYDFFNTGHASTSISAAQGITAARRIQDKTGRAIAVIGDGAMTGGMVWEALNNIAHRGDDVIVILNDNQMSIDKNVGSLMKHLEMLRVNPHYLSFKTHLEPKLLKIPKIGASITRFLGRIKDGIRHKTQPKNVVFENLGFRYYGPIDGHDLQTLSRYFQAIKSVRGPVLLHINTKKGKGFKAAEAYPESYHGVSAFDLQNPPIKSSKALTPAVSLDALDQALLQSQTLTSAFSQSLLFQASHCSKILAITAAMSSGTGLEPFSKCYPERFFDVGIAEAHAVTLAAGLATEGAIPVVAIYSTFLQRALDQVLHDVVLQKLHVVFVLDRAGIVGEDGETHQGLYDLPFLAALPNIEVLCPSDPIELDAMLRYAVQEAKGPVFIRLVKGKIALDSKKWLPFSTEVKQPLSRSVLYFGKQHKIDTPLVHFSKSAYFDEILLKSAEKKILVLTFGSLLASALEGIELFLEGIEDDTLLIELCTIPQLFASESVVSNAFLSCFDYIISFEESVPPASLCTELTQRLLSLRKPPKYKAFHCVKHIIEQGSRQAVLESEGLDAKHLAQALDEAVEHLF